VSSAVFVERLSGPRHQQLGFKKYLSGALLTKDLSIGFVGMYTVYHWEKEFSLRKIFRETFI
jgi:hypothetical protein